MTGQLEQEKKPDPDVPESKQPAAAEATTTTSTDGAVPAQTDAVGQSATSNDGKLQVSSKSGDSAYTGGKLSSKVEAIRSKRSSTRQVTHSSNGKSAKTYRKSLASVKRPSVEVVAKGEQSPEELKTAMATVQCLPGVKMLYDEANLERLGYHFQRQVIATTKRGFVYQAFGMLSVPVVCKIALFDSRSQQDMSNFQQNSARITRFVGGNGGDPPHSAFIRVYGLFQVESKTYIFMDEVPTQSLLQVIKSRVKFSQQDVREWMASLCDAVQFLQARGIAHRRVKIDHILFDRAKTVKLAGWTRAVFYWDSEKAQALLLNKESKSTVNCHLPPEVFQGQYDPSLVDKWSLGVLLCNLHTRRHIFKPKSRVRYDIQWATFVGKHRISSPVLELLQSVFVVEPSKRASLAAMTQAKYFSSPVEELEQPMRRGATKSTLQSSISQGIVSGNSQLQSKPSAASEANDEDLETADQDAQSENEEPAAAQEDGGSSGRAPN